MHEAHHRRVGNPEGADVETSRQVTSPVDASSVGNDTWFVPPVVIPAVLIIGFVVLLLFG